VVHGELRRALRQDTSDGNRLHARAHGQIHCAAAGAGLMDRYCFTLTRQYDSEEYCQSIRINIASEEIHAVVSAFADFLESAGFQPESIKASMAAAGCR
jgi:hypothetical protein